MDQRLVDLLRSSLPLAGDRPLTAETALTDLGLDSMTAVTIFLDIEGVFGVALPEEDLDHSTFATVGSLWAAIDAAQAAARDGRGVHGVS